MRHILFAALAAAAMIGAAGCHGPEKGSGLAGTYEGTFPCADCGGKDICLTICGDGTYCLKYSYRDRDERQIEENGTYSILGSVLVETVTPSSGEKTYYKYVQGNLVLSDSLGTVNDGPLARLYVLEKKKLH